MRFAIVSIFPPFKNRNGVFPVFAPWQVRTEEIAKTKKPNQIT